MSRGPRQRSRTLLLAAGLAVATLLGQAYAGGAAAARPAAGLPVHGGTLHVAYSGSMQTFDPAQAFNDDWWAMNGTLFNALYRLDRHGKPVLDLAAAPPTVSADRKVWTFKLRHGVRFSNGQELTAEDLRFSITRTLDPNLKPAPSWGQTTDEIFEGAAAFASGKAKTVPGIQVLDRYTIRFKLVQPVSVLPYILAETFNFALPESVVTKMSESDFADRPVGTGPFEIVSWHKGSQIVFKRNPYYFRTGKPYVDKLIIDTNVPANLIALRVQSGEIDGSGNGSELAAADIEQARKDPRFAKYLVQGPIVWLSWLNLNVHAAPLDNPTLRRAIAMAINRQKLVRFLGGLAAPTGNLYIPIYPQNDPRLDRSPVYPYDPAKAAALVKTSGYKGQAITLLYPADFGYNAGEATGIQQDLQRIALNVQLRPSTTTSLTQLGTKFTGHQLSIFNWSPDYPDGYDVYVSEFSCAVNAEGGISRAHYCDPTADALVDKASVMPLGAARDSLLRQAQLRILQSAAYVPLVYNLTVAMVNPRVQGFYYHPMYGWQYEDYWLKS